MNHSSPYEVHFSCHHKVVEPILFRGINKMGHNQGPDAVTMKRVKLQIVENLINFYFKRLGWLQDMVMNVKPFKDIQTDCVFRKTQLLYCAIATGPNNFNSMPSSQSEFQNSLQQTLVISTLFYRGFTKICRYNL